MNINFFLFLLIFAFSLKVSFATVGGPQILKFLGYNGNNLYFVYEYYDEKTNPPELWRYDISGDSLYITREWIKFPEESIDEALKRNDLEKLKLPDTITANPKLTSNFGKPVRQYMETMEVFYDLYPVEVRWGKEVYEIYQCFDSIEKPEINRAYSLKDLDVSIAILRYKGICFETGYLKDTLLIKSYQEEKLIPNQKPSDNDDEDQWPLIIALTALSAILMLRILFRRSSR